MIETLFDQDYLRDPHPVYARLRAERPVFRTATPQGVQVWVVSRLAWRPGLLMHGLTSLPVRSVPVEEEGGRGR
ncbi:hypothetical protein [Nonomuraea sp. NPDC049784]|uniref:hypothetical protein n=1 Tax=Nonomuraea sp. NPDC049784 TaxID=3154361 RepID=UPI0033FD07CE